MDNKAEDSQQSKSSIKISKKSLLMLVIILSLVATVFFGSRSQSNPNKTSTPALAPTATPIMNKIQQYATYVIPAGWKEQFTSSEYFASNQLTSPDYAVDAEGVQTAGVVISVQRPANNKEDIDNDPETNKILVKSLQDELKANKETIYHDILDTQISGLPATGWWQSSLGYSDPYAYPNIEGYNFFQGPTNNWSILIKYGGTTEGEIQKNYDNYKDEIDVFIASLNIK